MEGNLRELNESELITIMHGLILDTNFNFNWSENRLGIFNFQRAKLFWKSDFCHIFDKICLQDVIDLSVSFTKLLADVKQVLTKL